MEQGKIEQGKIDRVILGHNQFFGINHLSSERAKERERMFNDPKNIIAMIRFAYEQGAKGLMLNTHEKAKVVAKLLREDRELRDGLRLYVLLPYMAKYVKAANEKGLVSMIGDIVSQASWSDRVQIGLNLGKGMVLSNQTSNLKALIDVEMLPFKGLNLQAVFLHNSLTDLVVAFQMRKVVEFYRQYIAEQYGCEGAFCTLTSAPLLHLLKDMKIASPLIMAPFNPIGFQMSPSRQACEEALRGSDARVIAMSVMAGGALRPEQTAEYLKNLPQVCSVIVGASRKSTFAQSHECFAKIFANG